MKLLWLAPWLLGSLLHAESLILDRPLRAESAKLSAIRHVEGAFGFEYYRVTGLEDEMGSPLILKWSLSPQWQLRIASVGWTGEAKGFLTYSELHDIKIGAQFSYLSSTDASLDASLRAYLVGVDTKKQRYILTALWSATWGHSTWDLNTEVTVPLQGTAMRLKGTVALGGKIWNDPLGWGLGYYVELPQFQPTLHFLQATMYYKLAPDCVLDVGYQTEVGLPSDVHLPIGGQNSFGVWNANYMVSLGVSFLFGKM